MTTCNAIGALMVGGRVVGQIRCEREAGHAEGIFPRVMSEPGAIPTVYQFEPTPHAMTLTWTPEAEPDLDLFDPGEVMDVDVPFGNPDARPCQLCGFPCDVDGH